MIPEGNSGWCVSRTEQSDTCHHYVLMMSPNEVIQNNVNKKTPKRQKIIIEER